LFRCVRLEGRVDEALVLVPGWLDYPLYLEHLGFRVKLVPCDPRTLRLDLQAIRRALSPNTRLLVLSQPANPSGVVYTADELQALAAVLEAAPHPPLLISDECHRDIRFDDEPFVSPAEYYDATCIVYSFGKSWSMQGQRIGYAAISPRMPEARMWAERLETWCRIMGYATPTALMQLAVRSLVGRRPDVTRIAARRARAVQHLRASGYDLLPSQATFFLYPRTPAGLDDWSFTERLAEAGVLVLPAPLFHHEGFFRLSLTCTDEALGAALAILGDEQLVAREARAS
jgi:aspartate aminotransferase